MNKEQIDWQSVKFRASSWGNLMTEPKTKEDKLAGKLSVTCQKELIKIYTLVKYGRKKEVVTNKMDKGVQAEEDSITLFSRVEKTLYEKNVIPLENEWFTGHPDIYKGYDIISAEEVWDIKSRWELDSYLPKLNEEPDNGEELQLQVYFSLTGAKCGGIANTLVDCPVNILMEEKRRLLYSMNVVSEESPEYVQAAAQLEKLLTFPDIDYRERVIKQPIKRDDELIEKMKAKVPVMRQWLADFEEKHMKMYPK
jgi:hypothetical protein